MAIGRLATILASGVGVTGFGAGTHYLYGTLHPYDSEDIALISSKSTMRRVTHKQDFDKPGYCTLKLFSDLDKDPVFSTTKPSDNTPYKMPKIIETRTIGIGQTDETAGENDEEVTRVFKNNQFDKEPAVGCVTMNMKRSTFANGFWKGELMGEIALQSGNEGWVWFMSAISGEELKFLQIHIRLSGDKWTVTHANSGTLAGNYQFFPRNSKFWDLKMWDSPHQECINDQDRKINNSSKCKDKNISWKKETVWTGIWVEKWGLNSFTSFVDNPYMIHAWNALPKVTKTQVKTEEDKKKKTIEPQTKPVLYAYSNNKWQKAPDGSDANRDMIWSWNDERKGDWFNLEDMCGRTSVSGANKEYMDEMSKRFCII